MSERISEITSTQEARRISAALEREQKLTDIQFSGYNKDNAKWFSTHRLNSEEWTKSAIAAIGLPVDNLEEVIFTENTKEDPNTLGSWGVGGAEIGKFRLYKLLKEIPPVAQIGTMTHELAHANTPFNEENNALYGSEEARERAAKHAEAIAEQTIATRVFLNPYHRQIFGIYEATVEKYGENSDKALQARKLLDEETHAIMSQLRLENPKHLAQVEAAQHASLERRRRGGEDVPEPVHILSHKDAEGNVVVDGIDTTLISLIPEVDTLEDLNNHFRDLKTRFAQDDRSDNSRVVREVVFERLQTPHFKAA